MCGCKQEKKHTFRATNWVPKNQKSTEVLISWKWFNDEKIMTLKTEGVLEQCLLNGKQNTMKLEDFTRNKWKSWTHT